MMVVEDITLKQKDSNYEAQSHGQDASCPFPFKLQALQQDVLGAGWAHSWTEAIP